MTLPDSIKDSCDSRIVDVVVIVTTTITVVLTNDGIIVLNVHDAKDNE